MNNRRMPTQRSAAWVGLSWPLFAVPLGLALGAAVGLNTSVQAEPDRTPARSLHSEGMQPLLGLSVQPIRSRTTASGREQLDYEVSVAPTRPLRTTLKYTYEIIAAPGTLIASSTSPNVTTGDDGRAYVGSFRTPADLADGYYAVRVTAAGSNQQATNATMAKQYFRVAQGRITSLGFEQWSAQSGSNRARTIVSSFQPRDEAEARARFAAPVQGGTP